LAHEGGKVVSHKQWQPLPHRKYSWYSFLSETESTSWPWYGWKDYVNGKIPMRLAGINPATFCLIAQCRSLLRHFVLPYLTGFGVIFWG